MKMKTQQPKIYGDTAIQACLKNKNLKRVILHNVLYVLKEPEKEQCPKWEENTKDRKWNTRKSPKTNRKDEWNQELVLRKGEQN